MVIIHVMGGLGNQLYQYAMYEKLKSLGKDVKLDLYAFLEDTSSGEKEWRSFELDKFEHLQYEICSLDERTRLLDNDLHLLSRIRRKLLGRQDKTLLETKPYMDEIYRVDDAYLYGFWGCERYYEDIIPMLQRNLSFPNSADERNTQCLERIVNENAVSIHIRRSDYLTVADGKRYMGICTEDYYKAAIGYIEANVTDPVFYIFSDDVSYAKAHFDAANMHIVDWNTGEDSIFDMKLMACCKHNICANSTFSEWGARLNQNVDKIMIKPLRHDNYETSSVEEMKQLWKKWILIDEKGNNISHCSGL